MMNQEVYSICVTPKAISFNGFESCGFQIPGQCISHLYSIRKSKRVYCAGKLSNVFSFAVYLPESRIVCITIRQFGSRVIDVKTRIHCNVLEL